MELLFLALLVFLMAFALGSGYPVAFALPGAAILSIGAAAGAGYLFADNPDAYFHSGGPQQWLSAGVTNLRGTFWEVERDTLIAIPLFIFMGIMLQRSKIAEDLLVTMAKLFGPVPGGLGISVVFVGALLAATTGIVGATVVAMGLISLPAMLRNNYSPSLATGTIAASGTLGQIIPPSIVLIILADQLAAATDQASTARKALHKEATGELSMPSAFDVTSTSAGEMFLGAFVPGLVLVGLYMVYILVYAIIRPKNAPAVANEDGFNAQFWGQVALILIPPLTLIFLVLGSIIGGIATVNQAGAIGAAGALVMAGYRLHAGGRFRYVPAIIGLAALGVLAFAISNYEMNLTAADSPEDWTGINIGLFGTGLMLVSLIWSGWRAWKNDDTLYGVMMETAKTTALVFIILLGAAMLTAAFRAFGGEELVRDFLNSLPGGFWAKFIIVMAVIFILGFFLDFIEIAVVVVPIVAPILLADPSANITAVWLGVMIGLNIQTSFLTPPFGFALFYLRGVAPAVVKTVQMYKGVIAFISLQLLALAIVGFYPQLVNYLPNRVSLLSDTAPPPRNPKLQFCIDEYVSNTYASNGAAIAAAHETARGLDLSVLPRDMARDLTGAIDEADNSQALLATAQEASAAVEAASDDFRGIHDEVRDIERIIREDEAEMRELRTLISRLGPDDTERRERMETRIAALEAEIAEVRAQIPAEWPDRQAAYNALLKTETDAWNAYRRAADGSYNQIAEVVDGLESSEAFLALEEELRALVPSIPGAEADYEATGEIVDAVADKFSNVAGASDIASELSKVRRSLTGRRVNPEAAVEAMQEAISLYEAQKAWRAEAAPVTPQLVAYRDQIRDVIGIRTLDRMPRDVALEVAACNSVHRDLSLSF